MASMLSEAAEQQDVSSDDFDTMVKAAVDDDQRAVRWLVERYHSDLVDYAGRNGAPDPDGIADLIMARVLARLGGLESLTDEGLETYLFRSLRREMNREIAREQAGRLALVGDPELTLEQLTAPGFEDAFDDAALVESLLDELTDNQRQVVVGRYLRDRTYEELGVELGLTPAAVRKTSSRAIARLRVVLGLVVAGSLVVALIVLNATARPETVVDTAPIDARPNRVLVVEDPSIDLSENPERSSGRIATGTVPDDREPGDGGDAGPVGDRAGQDPVEGIGAGGDPAATPPTVAGQAPQAPTTTPGPTTSTSTSVSASADRDSNGGAFWLDLSADLSFWSSDIVFGDAAFSDAIGSTFPLGQRLSLTIDLESTGGKEVRVWLLTPEPSAVVSRPVTISGAASVSQWVRFDSATDLSRIRVVATDVATGRSIYSQPLEVSFQWVEADPVAAPADAGDDDGGPDGDDDGDDGGGDG